MTKLVVRTFAFAFALALPFLIAHAFAHASGTPQLRYRLVHGRSHITSVVIARACMGGEDSAGALVLKGYGDNVARYGCRHRGY